MNTRHANMLVWLAIMFSILSGLTHTEFVHGFMPLFNAVVGWICGGNGVCALPYREQAGPLITIIGMGASSVGLVAFVLRHAVPFAVRGDCNG
jgi:hypothetical protein